MAEDRWKQLARETYETLPLAPTSTYRAMEALALRVAREAWREGAGKMLPYVSHNGRCAATRNFERECDCGLYELKQQASLALPLPEPAEEK